MKSRFYWFKEQNPVEYTIRMPTYPIISTEDIIYNNQEKIFSVLWWGNEWQKYKWLYSLQNTHVWKAILKEIMNNLNIGINWFSTKELVRNAWNLRSEIKKSFPWLLQQIDQPQFLVLLSNILAWFYVYEWNTPKWWKNNTENLTSTIKNILSQDKLLLTWFLCAHRENDTIEENALAKNLNIDSFVAIKNLLKNICESTGKSYEIEFSHIQGNSHGINAVFSKVFHKYFESWTLYKIAELLDWHYNEIKNIEEKNELWTIRIIWVDTHVNNTENELEKKYWKNWGNLSIKDIINFKNSGDTISRIALNTTLDDIKRLWSTKEYNKKELMYLIKLNIKNAHEHWNKEIIKKAIEMNLQKHNLIGISLYETMFYYLWGSCMYKTWWIWVWFDRWHELYQTEAFIAWYNEHSQEKNNSAPILYWRRTGKKSSGEDISKLSFRQFRHH
jgi:hypothetical protein